MGRPRSWIRSGVCRVGENRATGCLNRLSALSSAHGWVSIGGVQSQKRSRRHMPDAWSELTALSASGQPLSGFLEPALQTG